MVLESSGALGFPSPRGERSVAGLLFLPYSTAPSLLPLGLPMLSSRPLDAEFWARLSSAQQLSVTPRCSMTKVKLPILHSVPCLVSVLSTALPGPRRPSQLPNSAWPSPGVWHVVCALWLPGPTLFSRRNYEVPQTFLSCFSPKDETIPSSFEVPKPLCIFFIFSKMKFPLQKQETSENTKKQKKNITQISPTRNGGCHTLWLLY